MRISNPIDICRIVTDKLVPDPRVRFELLTPVSFLLLVDSHRESFAAVGPKVSL